MMPDRYRQAAPYLDDLLAECDVAAPCPSVPLLGMTLDSRAIEPGWLFVALAGTRAHGMTYAEVAKQRGAAAILAEPTAEWDEDGIGRAAEGLQIPIVPVNRLSGVVSCLAAVYYGDPARRLRIAGVTGTNGKSSVSHFLAQSLSESRSCGVLGTLGYGFPGRLQPATHTTPDAVNLQRLLNELRSAGAQVVAMEVSSHALHQHRVVAVPFHTAVFTNLSREHLDYHRSMEAYAEAKAELFRRPELRLAVVNRDDALGRRLLKELRGRVTTVSCGSQTVSAVSADHILTWHHLRTQPDGLRFGLDSSWGAAQVDSSLLGAFNVENLTLVLGVLLSWGFDLERAVDRLRQLRAIPGRMEAFGGRGELPLVVVDYAHTPDALQKALLSLRPHASARLVCVFGCGGDRDRGKRPLMAATAERHADKVWLTDDNPRHEDSRQIFADIMEGFAAAGAVSVERDRGRAIQAAVRRARAGDVVLVAGKGHEDYQQVGDLRFPFSDAQQVRAVLRELAP